MRVTKPGEALFLKGLIFGPTGHGKTTFVATAQFDPRTAPALFVDFEGGEQSLAGLDVDVTHVRSWRQWERVYSDLVAGKQLAKFGPNAGEPFRSVLVDSISETHIFALFNILDREAASRNDPDQLEQRDYGRASIQMRRLLRSFRDLPHHVLFTAQTRDSVEPRVGTVKRPALSGQLSEELVGMMDASIYLALMIDDQLGKQRRALLLQNQAQFRVKVRTPWGVTDMPDEIIEEEPREFAERGVTILLDTLQARPAKPKRRRAS